MAHASGLQFTLTLPGGEDVAVIDFIYREALSAPFELRVTLASRDPEIAPADTLDRNATLTVWQDGEPLRRVHGIVSEFGRGDRGHRRTFYTLVIRPALWRLDLRHNSRIFQDTPPQDILATLCDERGLRDVAFALTREPAEREFCVQYRETDLAFVERLAAEEGLVYLHEFENAEGGAHRLVFIDATQLLPRVGERTYHGRAGGTPPRRHIRKLRQVSRVRPASAMLKDYTFKNPAYDQLHEHPAPGLGEHAQREDYEHFDYPGRYKADASGVPFTRVRLEALRAEANTAQAESDLPELAPGMCFTLTDHDIDALNRDWQVVAVVHHGEQPQALEEDGVAQGEAAGQGQMTRYYNELVLAPAERVWRPEPPVRPRVDGPQVAVVVGPEGEEIHCDEHGRVKVQFPWDRYAEPDTAGAGGEAAERGASAWIRVSQGWAGGGYGAMAIPRIGHEVIVSFLEGDPDQPIITGRTYHAVNTPPYALPAHKTRTVLRTQSHKAEGFNELRFEDATDAEQIWLHAQMDLELLTLNDRTETIRRDSHLAIERHRLGEIHGDDHLTVHGQRHTQVKGEGGQHLTVHGSLHLEAGQAWLTESGRELHIKAGQKAVLNAGREITLKAGGSFIKLDASGVTIVGPRIKVNAGGSPGTGSGQHAEPPRLPGEAIPESSEDVTLKAHQQALLDDEMVSYNPGQEAGRVVSSHWDNAKAATRTAWEALPFTSDDDATKAARGRVVQGTQDTYQGLRTLSGPSAISLARSTLSLRSGDIEPTLQYVDDWQRTTEAYGAIWDAGTEAWQDASERNGIPGALEMSATAIAIEAVGGRGSGAASSAAGTARRAPDGDGVSISRNATNHQRAAFGEARAHDLMTRNGLEPIGRTDGIYLPGQTGIDGIYRHPSPPPDFVITEAKFGRSRLKRLADGSKQMDNRWVQRNLFEAVDGDNNPALFREVDRARRAGRIDKYLVRVKPDGSSRVRLLDNNARVIGDAPGF